ncbi:MAG: single-stranded DNA-binding protein [Lachnospiraceae bacterium]|nr:single-stranded DNA-binding protein [Lachnospiraceae bacterium]
MNKVILMGRLTKDPEVRYSSNDSSLAIARFTLAVDRRRGRQANGDNQPTADFISCVSFGKTAEFAEKYFHKGIKIAITGRIQTSNYTNKDGNKVYVTEVVVEEQEFAESKKASDQSSSYYNAPAGGNNNGGGGSAPQGGSGDDGGFMNIPDGIEDELPFA